MDQILERWTANREREGRSDTSFDVGQRRCGPRLNYAEQLIVRDVGRETFAPAVG